jgi:DNA-binding NtrC family response regulator
MPARILIVDDDPVQRRLLEENIRRFGYDVTVLDGGEPAMALLTSQGGADIDLVVLDLVMPDLDGMTVLTRLMDGGFDRPVIVQTARGGIDTVVGAMRAGAFDFIVKPAGGERLQVALANALKVNALESEIQRQKRSAAGTMSFKDIVTRSPEMERVIRLGERAAASTIPILVEGESGVGKELVARAIQGTGNRRTKPFVTVNCGALAPNLVESILFGHEKGSFTGASERHVGKFQEADGGTLFLDEVGELPLDTQVKLLRAIQEGEIDPVGGRRPVRVDFRLISATNRSLIDLVKAGAFREDLFYRLNVFPVFVPPLRNRREDIAELVRHFIARFAAEEGKRRIRGIRPDALGLLEDYTWPGNIRQLENAVFRAVVLCDGTELTLDEFPQVLAQLGQRPRLPEIRPAAVARTPETPAVPPFGFTRSLGDDGHVRTLEALEAEMIVTAIAHYGGRMAEVARRLGIGRSTLYRKLKEYGIAAEGETGGEDAAEDKPFGGVAAE